MEKCTGIKGGWNVWKQAGLPVSAGKQHDRRSCTGGSGRLCAGPCGSFSIPAGCHSSTIDDWRMPAATGVGKTMYLTFDDGPNPAATPALLDLLKEKNVRATLFLIDDYVNETTVPIVRRIFNEGHSVGLHTGRRWLLLRSPSYVEKTLQSAATRIERLTSHRPCPLFRPHAGWRSSAMIIGARRAGYTVTGWSWMSWRLVGNCEAHGRSCRLPFARARLAREDHRHTRWPSPESNVRP